MTASLHSGSIRDCAALSSITFFLSLAKMMGSAPAGYFRRSSSIAGAREPYTLQMVLMWTGENVRLSSRS